MGLLDSLGGMLGGQGQNADQIKAIMAWVEQQGGITALIEKFKSQGLGSIIESWIGTGITNRFPANRFRMYLALNLLLPLQAHSALMLRVHRNCLQHIYLS